MDANGTNHETLGNVSGRKPGIEISQMVVIRNAYKDYGFKKKVLEGLNMTVQKGSIYAFLGPSGCGKTTLLQCVVGNQALDSGEIHLGVQYSHELGYMPQGLAIVNELSIKEMLIYYGIIYGMTRQEINKKITEMVELFEMPSTDRIIGTLSGGQMRRVSLCITFLHNPKLLILDEPTVGVDPLLSDRIWKYLIEMTRDGERTIVITTHYIEEAKQANTVGLMRNGIILEEGKPQDILNQYGCERLEDVFLEISKRQDNKTDSNPSPQQSHFLINAAHILKKSLSEKTEPCIKRKEMFSLNRLYAHIYKNIYFLLRNHGVLVILITLPLMMSSLFLFTIGPDPKNLKIGVVNNELLNGRSDCAKAPHNCSRFFPASCYFMDELDQTEIEVVIYDDPGAARTAAEKNYIWGYLQIPVNYTEALHLRIELSMKSTEDILESSSVNVWLDMSNALIANFIRKDLYLTYYRYLEKFYLDCGWPGKAAGIPIAMNDAVYGDNHPLFVDFVIPCILLEFSYVLPFIMIIAAVLTEKRNGFLERSLTSGLTLVEVVMGHSIVCLVLLIIQIMTMMVVIFVFEGRPLIGSATLAYLLCFVVGISGMFNGFLVAIVCESDISATYVGVGSVFPLFMVSGMLWPRQGMHPILKSISHLLPMTLASESFRSITLRAWTISDPLVYEGFIVGAGWTIIFMVVCIFIGKMKSIYMKIVN